MSLHEGEKVKGKTDTSSYAGNFRQYKYSLNRENCLEEDRSHCKDTTSSHIAASS